MDVHFPRRSARRHTPPVDEMLVELGGRIRDLRVGSGLSQAAMGDPYLTRGAVSSIERGRSIPSLRALAHFARKLNIELRDLFPERKKP